MIDVDIKQGHVVARVEGGIIKGESLPGNPMWYNGFVFLTFDEITMIMTAIGAKCAADFSYEDKG